MKTEINNIPSVIWNGKSDRVIIAVHGKLSSKTDMPIQLLAEAAEEKGIQVLSFDFPKHGERQNSKESFDVFQCTKELNTVYEYAENKWSEIYLFANSIGAYFSLIALRDKPVKKALFLSPLVNMQTMLSIMMKTDGITEERLCREKNIQSSFGEMLNRDYYEFVKKNPITKWNTPTYILCGKNDFVVPYSTVSDFCDKFGADAEVSESSEHWFHTDEDLKILKDWFKRNI